MFNTPNIGIDYDFFDQVFDDNDSLLSNFSNNQRESVERKIKTYNTWLKHKEAYVEVFIKDEAFDSNGNILYNSFSVHTTKPFEDHSLFWKLFF